MAELELEPAVELLRHHGLTAMAYAHGARSLRHDYVVNLFSVDKRQAVLAEAVAALSEAGIEVALLTGISYAGDLYPDPAVRVMGDLDLLVGSSELKGALGCLQALGYRDGTPGGSSPSHHALQLFRGDGGAIDLHQNIEQPWRSRIDLHEVWARAVPAEDVPGARRLERVDQLLFHLTHMSRSELMVPLMNYIDAAALERRLSAADIEELMERTRRYGVERGCVVARAMGKALREGRDRAWLPLWGRILPDCEEVVRGRLPSRHVQLARKAVLNDRWSQLAGLGAVFVTRRAIGWWQRRGQGGVTG